jgi:hypothetical protein
MNSPFLRLVVLTLGLSLLLACRSERDDNRPIPAPPPSIYEPDPDAPPGTGRLRVYVFAGERYQPVREADISLYLSLADLERDLYLDRGVTGRSGVVDFGYLNAGNYYVLVEHVGPETRYSLTEPLQVQLGQTLTRNLILY